MKIEIDFNEIIKTDLFTTSIAEHIAGRMGWELLREEWEELFMKEYKKKLKALVKGTAEEWLNEFRQDIVREVRSVLEGLTKKEIISVLTAEAPPKERLE